MRNELDQIHGEPTKDTVATTKVLPDRKIMLYVREKGMESFDSVEVVVPNKKNTVIKL